jgi:hypothetical protein
VPQTPFWHTSFLPESLHCAVNAFLAHFLSAGEPSLCFKLLFGALPSCWRAYIVLQTSFWRTFSQPESLLCASNSVLAHFLTAGESTLCCKLRFGALPSCRRAYIVLQTPFPHFLPAGESTLCFANFVLAHLLKVEGSIFAAFTILLEAKSFSPQKNRPETKSRAVFIHTNYFLKL